MLALASLYARRSEASGALGIIGFLVALIGTGLLVGMIWANAFVAPTLAVEAPAVLDAEPAGALAFGFILSTTVFGLSWALFGVALLRARTYPRVATILLIIGALLVIMPLPATGFVIVPASLSYRLRYRSDPHLAWYDLLEGRGTRACPWTGRGRGPTAGTVVAARKRV